MVLAEAAAARSALVERRACSALNTPSTLSEDGAPAASLHRPEAEGSPTHPVAPPQPLGGVPWPQQPASGRPKAEDFPLSNHQAQGASDPAVGAARGHAARPRRDHRRRRAHLPLRRAPRAVRHRRRRAGHRPAGALPGQAARLPPGDRARAGPVAQRDDGPSLTLVALSLMIIIISEGVRTHRIRLQSWRDSRSTDPQTGQRQCMHYRVSLLYPQLPSSHG